jgi:hypothetical protein
MDPVTSYVLAQALHPGRVDTANQVVSALCAACSWAANNMGWPLLFSGSVVAGVGAAARAAIDGWIIGATTAAASFLEATFPSNKTEWLLIRLQRQCPNSSTGSIRP